MVEVPQQPALEEIFLREFSQMTPENELKWDAIRPSRRRFDFTVSDQMIGYAAAHGKRVRGHALVWGEQNPAWLTNGSWTRDSLLTVMKTHIETVMQRYRGQVAEWVVVNEAIDDDGSYRDNIWLRVIGPDSSRCVPIRPPGRSRCAAVLQRRGDRPRK